ncbi:hypothetical protein [Kineosporia succinea]|uniref:Membrane protein YgcG n=1 Tax=Kineosporia succinea TaxID=84632 RepID=A0ABT9PFC0_9ACTN|nr:hypothetical protein [Kineosporia succinea]MDP9831152.1 putative membrane protein YgcG [Kineosporia succinea]
MTVTQPTSPARHRWADWGPVAEFTRAQRPAGAVGVPRRSNGFRTTPHELTLKDRAGAHRYLISAPHPTTTTAAWHLHLLLDQQWPVALRERLAPLGDVYVFEQLGWPYTSSLPAVPVGEQGRALIADHADLRRWNAARTALTELAGEIGDSIRHDWTEADALPGRLLPWRRRAWRDALEAHAGRLVAAYEEYRPVIPEIEAALDATASALADVKTRLSVVHGWYGRTRWQLVPAGDESFRLVRPDLDPQAPTRRAGLLHDVQHQARDLRFGQLKAVLWDEASVRLCDRELADASADLPRPVPRPGDSAGPEPSWRSEQLTSTGDPLVTLVPATFDGVYRMRLGTPPDELTDPVSLEADRHRERERQEREKEQERRWRERVNRPGGSWPTTPGSGDFGAGHGGGDHGGGGYSGGGHSGGFGGSF